MGWTAHGNPGTANYYEEAKAGCFSLEVYISASREEDGVELWCGRIWEGEAGIDFSPVAESEKAFVSKLRAQAWAILTLKGILQEATEALNATIEAMGEEVAAWVP